MKHMTVSTMLIMSVFILGGCAETRGTYGMMNPDFPKYGFLGEYYDKLEPGDEKEYEPALRYQAPNFKEIAPTYTKLLLDPVVFFRAEKDPSTGISQEDAQTLANYLHNQIYLALKDDIEIVDHVGPNTLRVAISMTDAETRWVGLDIISTFVPQLRVVSELKGFVSGKPSFAGKAVAEAKVTDAQTGQMLVAAVDKRVGGKTLGKGFSEWADVTDAMDYWSQMLKYRLCRVQNRQNCEPPKA